jgi:hypothetical protein
LLNCCRWKKSRRRGSGGMDPVAVIAERTVQFSGATVTAERCGPSSGDSRVDGAVPGRSSDGDICGGYGGGGGVVRWRRMSRMVWFPGTAVKAEQTAWFLGVEAVEVAAWSKRAWEILAA